MSSTENVKSVERAMQILNCFSIESPELGITELSKKFKVSKSTIHRLVTSMQKHGFLEQDPVSQKYRLGYNILRLSEIILGNINIRNLALPSMQKLREQTKETVGLNIISYKSRVCIEKAESFQDLRRFLVIGRPLPLYAGAAGKILLAYQDEKFIQKVLQEAELKPFTENTVTDPQQIMEELASIKEKGYCITSGERVIGVISIAAPIWNYNNKVVASLTISGPDFRFTPEKNDHFLKLLLEETNNLSRQMGHSVV